MTNQDLIRKFKEGATRGVANHLYILDDELVNYSTTIAIRKPNGKFAINKRKYSQTTSKIQSKIRYILGNLIDEEFVGDSAMAWNYGYQGAPQIKASDVYND